MNKLLSPGQTMATMPMQHFATLLGVTCSARLATLLRHVGCCCLNANLAIFKFEPTTPNLTCRNISQDGGEISV